MMRTFFFPCFILYLLHLGLRYAHFALPTWLNSYWSDVLCLPIILTLSVWCVRRLQQKTTLLLEPKHIFVLWLYVSVVFEGILPMVAPKFRSDPFDILMYAVGGYLFYRFQSRFCDAKSTSRFPPVLAINLVSLIIML
jgi:hypothetical protein